jgi:hypothetical protein
MSMTGNVMERDFKMKNILVIMGILFMFYLYASPYRTCISNLTDNQREAYDGGHQVYCASLTGW